MLWSSRGCLKKWSALCLPACCLSALLSCLPLLLLGLGGGGFSFLFYFHLSLSLSYFRVVMWKCFDGSNYLTQCPKSHLFLLLSCEVIWSGFCSCVGLSYNIYDTGICWVHNFCPCLPVSCGYCWINCAVLLHRSDRRQTSTGRWPGREHQAVGAVSGQRDHHPKGPGRHHLWRNYRCELVSSEHAIYVRPCAYFMCSFAGVAVISACSARSRLWSSDPSIETSCYQTCIYIYIYIYILSVCAHFLQALKLFVCVCVWVHFMFCSDHVPALDLECKVSRLVFYLIIIKSSFMCYFFKLEYIAHYKAKNKIQSKQTSSSTRMHTHTHTHTHHECVHIHTDTLTQSQ